MNDRDRQHSKHTGKFQGIPKKTLEKAITVQKAQEACKTKEKIPIIQANS